MVVVPDGPTLGRLQNLDDALRGLLGTELARFVERLQVLVAPFRHANVVEVILKKPQNFDLKLLTWTN